MILRIELLQQELTNYKMLTVNPLTVIIVRGFLCTRTHTNTQVKFVSNIL